MDGEGPLDSLPVGARLNLDSTQLLSDGVTAPDVSSESDLLGSIGNFLSSLYTDLFTRAESESKGLIFDIPGLGKLPSQFTARFDGANYGPTDYTNDHNEGGASVSCNHHGLIDTETLVRGRVVSASKDQSAYYVLKVKVDNGAGVELYKGGTTTLIYRPEFGRWSLWTDKPNGEQWEVCNPDAVVGNLIAGLECYGGSSPELNTIIASLNNERARLVASIPSIWAKSDCRKKVVSAASRDYSPHPTSMP